MLLHRRADGGWATGAPPPPTPTTAPATAVVQIDACPVCNGAWFDAGELDLLAGEAANIEQALAPESKPSSRGCPRGCTLLRERSLPGQIRTPVDYCPTCGGLWLDGHERHKLAKSTTREGQQERSKRLARRGVIWAAQLLTHLPVEVENPAAGTPWVVIGLLLTVFMMFVAQLAGIVDLGDCVPGMGGLPTGDLCLAPVAGALLDQWHRMGVAALIQGSWYTLATHWMLHGSWAHLLGNCYFLYIFGDNVEHLFGHKRFALFFLAAAIGGGLGEVLLTSSSMLPIVGASGGIAGVMAAYLWCFPRNKLFQVVLFIQLKLPAWVYLFVWIGFQAVMGMFDKDASVAWFAHLFGFAIGAGLTPLILAQRRREVARGVRVAASEYRPAQA